MSAPPSALDEIVQGMFDANCIDTKGMDSHKVMPKDAFLELIGKQKLLSDGALTKEQAGGIFDECAEKAGEHVSFDGFVDAMMSVAMHKASTMHGRWRRGYHPSNAYPIPPAPKHPPRVFRKL